MNEVRKYSDRELMDLSEHVLYEMKIPRLADLIRQKARAVAPNDHAVLA
jgi:hypothetical protein